MKHPFYLAWVVLSLGALGASNLRGWRLLPGFGPTGPRYASSSSSFLHGWRSGGGGGFFHK